MFAGTELDMSVGMHQHIHLPWVVFAPPTPFYPHPAVGFIRDKLATKTKVDNRKAARTGSKFKILLVPHMPWIGPITHGTGKEGTGIQLGFMGAGIGVHPFGGVGFVTIEGKPALGMLSPLLGCWCVAPGFDMMVPFLGLDFLMVPTRMPTVLYGPAPLAVDLFVLLIANIECVLDYLIGKIKIPILKDIAKIAKDSLIEGLETAATSWETQDPPKSVTKALKAGTRAAGYSFVNGMVSYAAKKITGPLGKIPMVGAPVQKWATGQINTAVTGQIDELTDGDYKKYRDDKKQRQKDQKASPNKAFDAFEGVMTSGSKIANAGANAQLAQHKKDNPDFNQNDPKHKPLTAEQKKAATGIGKQVAVDAFKQAGQQAVQDEVTKQTVKPVATAAQDLAGGKGSLGGEIAAHLVNDQGKKIVKKNVPVENRFPGGEEEVRGRNQANAVAMGLPPQEAPPPPPEEAPEGA
jgi:hypothetical protein